MRLFTARSARLTAVGAGLILAIFARPVFGQNNELGNYRLLQDPRGCQAGPGCVPVIFIHGIHGSTQDGKECDLDHSVESDCYWSPLLNYLLERFNPPASTLIPKLQPYIFRYLSDKDDSTFEIGRKLLRLVDCEGITAYPSGIQSVPCKKISGPLLMVAHSMGGIVARSFMLQHTSVSPDPGYKRLLAAITLATPHHGTQVANRSWRDWQADRLNVGISDILPGDFLDYLDAISWGVSGSFHLSNDSSRPNRSDLVWDNYDGYFDAAKAAIPNDYWELNQLLSDLATSNQARKLIVYGGFLNPLPLKAQDLLKVGDPHIQLTVGAAVMRDKLRVLIGSDGVVPLDSALFIKNPYVVLRRSAFSGYDHRDMAGNPPGDSHASWNEALFQSVAADLDAVLKWQGVPPRLLSILATPDPVVSGSVVRLTYRLKTAFETPTRILLKVSMSGISSCEVTEAQPGDNSVERNFQIPTAISVSPAIVTGEVLPDTVPVQREMEKRRFPLV